ncbi:uncharacterized protein LOC126896104 [Daktulosphaira vitifoliae]|uniref:uncharacterized protein LOC126896104 n=1 Tax=Daktulosphaira vitifoliae TaxID=58002 RepID=UPI0021AA0A5C|nr:uncharacterized protein LOC126896104 [Daktulosphaira vitifoliae]XP_050524536.1 uncharacterized protein LOC126896104 [Daktulosphaira vitifoliae]XP_050524537.1 uncharacterized protein LOC126896104 [Daktulosphaira vitifoliae]
MFYVANFVILTLIGFVNLPNKTVAITYSKNNVPFNNKIQMEILEKKLKHLENISQVDKRVIGKIKTFEDKKINNLFITVNYHLITLRCMYTFNIYHHMILTQYLVKDNNYKKIDERHLFEIITQNKEIIRNMLSTSISMGVKEIEALWLIYIYMEKSNTNIKYIIQNHEFLVKYLADHTGCHYCQDQKKYNFNFVNTNLKECNQQEPFNLCIEKVKSLVKENTDTINTFMKKNAEHGITTNNLDLIDSKHLYIHDVFIFDQFNKFSKDLKTYFQIGVNWKSVIPVYKEYNLSLHYPEGFTNFTNNMKIYQSGLLNFIKLFVIRALHVHLRFPDEKINQYTDKIINIVQKFKTFLALPDKDHLHLISNLYYSQEKKSLKDLVVKCEKDIVKDICANSNLEPWYVVNPDGFIMNPESISLHLDKKLDKSLENLVIKYDILYDDFQSDDKLILINVKLLKVFCEYIIEKSDIKDINFNIVNSFLYTNSQGGQKTIITKIKDIFNKNV